MIEYIPIKDLNLLDRNPRKITDTQFKKLCKSLKEDPGFFEKRPVLVNRKDGQLIVYAGNQRIRAAEKIGLKTVPCSIDTDLSDTLMKRRVVADNKQFGEFDWDILSSDYDLDELFDVGFTELELGISGINPINEDEEEPEEKKKKVCPHCGEIL